MSGEAVQALTSENATLKHRVRQLTQEHRKLQERLEGARSNSRFADRRIADLETQLLANTRCVVIDQLNLRPNPAHQTRHSEGRAQVRSLTALLRASITPTSHVPSHEHARNSVLRAEPQGIWPGQEAAAVDIPDNGCVKYRASLRLACNAGAQLSLLC